MRKGLQQQPQQALLRLLPYGSRVEGLENPKPRTLNPEPLLGF